MLPTIEPAATARSQHRTSTTRDARQPLALGSSRGDVAYLLLRHSLRPVVIGALAGCVAALGAGRLLAGMLFNVSSADPVALIAAAALMLGTGAVAAWWPARRASGLAPGTVLRED